MWQELANLRIFWKGVVYTGFQWSGVPLTWSLLGACHNPWVSDPNPETLNQNLHVNQITSASNTHCILEMAGAHHLFSEISPKCRSLVSPAIIAIFDFQTG